jgi:hypothetical protein
MLGSVSPRLCPRAAASIALALLLLAGAASTAAAPARSRVAVVRPPADDEVSGLVTTRILAELSAAGFDVVEIDAPPDTSSRAVVEAPSKAVATFAVERVGNRPAVDVWLADQITGKTTVRRLDLQIGASDRAVAILAIRAVELLRASLLEIVVPAKAEADNSPDTVPADVATFVRDTSTPVRQTPRGLLEGVGIEMDAAVIHGFSGIGPSAGLALRGSWGVHKGFAARITLAGLEVGPTLRAPGGAATYGQEIGTVEGVYFASVAGPLSAFASAGAGVSRFHVKGSADSPNTPASADLWSPVATLGGGAGLRIAPGAAAILSLNGVLTLRRADVDIAGHVAATTGQPSLFATLGLLATF